VSDAISEQTLLRWAESLAGVARTGMGFTDSQFERERYEEILKIAGDIKAAADTGVDDPVDGDGHVIEWMKEIGRGSPGTSRQSGGGCRSDQ